MLKQIKVSSKTLNQWFYIGQFNGNFKPVRPYLTTHIPEIEGVDPSVKSYKSLYKFSVDEVCSSFNSY